MRADLSDPVVLKTFWQRLISVTDEQSAALIRTAFTPMVRDTEDLSAGVFDVRGRMIAQSVTGTPGHINSMATGMKHFLEVYPPRALDPGDVLITNDPWFTSGQLNDLTVATPVFAEDVLVGFFANTCHATDIGGLPLSADARDVYEEGLSVPIMKLYRRGEPNEDLFNILRSNVRTPTPVLGDLHAQVACNDVGARRLVALLGEFGLRDLEDAGTIITQRSEEAMRRAIKAMPDGTYESEVRADGYDQPVHIRVRVVVHGDELTVDYAGSSDQSPRGINVVLNYTKAYTTFAIKAAISPDVPNNDGSFRPVHVTAPDGSILNPRRPAAVAARAILGHFLPGAIFRALRPVLGDRAMAAGADSIWLVTVHGQRQDGDAFTYAFPVMGGTGARAHKDGLSTTGFPSGVAGTPAEVTENQTSILIHRREVRADSGGPGACRGGLGQIVEMSVRTRTAYAIGVTCDRTQFAAEGVAGGYDGALARTTLDGGQAINLKSTQRVPPDRRVVMELPGGGGFGSPYERAPHAVLNDVLQGYVSLDAAREHYGVVIHRSAPADELVMMAEDLHVDEAATARLRATRQPKSGGFM
jgi:N-methylhydantoinase B